MNDVNELNNEHSGPEMWTRYLDSHNSVTLEFIDDFKYDTQIYLQGSTTRISFFESATRYTDKMLISNMDLPAMLPAPMAMLVKEICITGITKQMTGGISQLTIGNKRYREVPLLWYYLHNVNAWSLSVPLFIGPLQHFKLELFWAMPVETKKYRTTLQCAMYGQIARAVC